MQALRIVCQLFGCAGLLMSIIAGGWIYLALTGAAEHRTSESLLVFASGGVLWSMATIVELLARK